MWFFPKASFKRIRCVTFTPDTPNPDHNEDDARVEQATQIALSNHADAQRAIRASVAALLDGALGGRGGLPA